MFKSNLLLAILCFLVLGISYGENSNPYYDPSKTHHTREGFTNPYLDDQKENKSFGDLINMIMEDRPDEDEIKKMYKLDLTENKRLERVRDLFVVGCRTGLRFSDLVNIRVLLSL